MRHVRYGLKNTSLVYPIGSKEIITLRLTEQAFHGDPKDFKRKPIPAGKYLVDVSEIWDNFYGQWAKVKHNGMSHDIAIHLFEWHREDQ